MINENIYSNGKGDYRKQPPYHFPFGEPLRKVEQKDRSPKIVFVLGVYASAVLAKWIDPEGSTLVRALAVASESEIFWNGGKAQDVISRINIPAAAGKLVDPGNIYNGPSGKALDTYYLAPLKLRRSDTQLCDIIPYSRLNRRQQEAIKDHYVDRIKEFGESNPRPNK